MSQQQAVDKLNYYLAQIDKSLSQYPQLNKLEKQTGVPKAYVVPAVAALFFVFIFFNIGAGFLSNFVGYALPAYWAIQAIESPKSEDDVQWLTYFVVFSFMTFAESLISIVNYFPFYYLFKVGFLVWLQLPQTQGAKTLYKSFLRPVFFQSSRASHSSTSTVSADDLRAKAASTTE